MAKCMCAGWTAFLLQVLSEKPVSAASFHEFFQPAKSEIILAAKAGSQKRKPASMHYSSSRPKVR